MNLEHAKANEVRSAWITVEPLLERKRRGEDVTYAEIERAGGGIDPRRLGTKVRGYFLRHRGIDLQPIPNVGWHIPTDEESVRTRGDFRRRRARRETKKMLLGVGSVDDAALVPETRRLRDLYIRHGATHVAADNAVNEERKVILGAPPARPGLTGRRDGDEH